MSLLKDSQRLEWNEERAMKAGELEEHVRALLAIIDDTGGYMTPENQQRIRDARSAVEVTRG